MLCSVVYVVVEYVADIERTVSFFFLNYYSRLAIKLLFEMNLVSIIGDPIRLSYADEIIAKNFSSRLTPTNDSENEMVVRSLFYHYLLMNKIGFFFFFRPVSLNIPISKASFEMAYIVNYTMFFRITLLLPFSAYRNKEGGKWKRSKEESVQEGWSDEGKSSLKWPDHIQQPTWPGQLKRWNANVKL